MSDLVVRPVTLSQAGPLLTLKQAIWPGETHALEQIRQGLSAAAQLTLLAWQGEQACGFAAAMPTRDAVGRRRWELDLLGVHPAARGRRLGTLLIDTMLQRLPRGPEEPVRALIATDNIASQAAFHRSGFSPAQIKLALYSCRLGAAGLASSTAIPAHLIPVQTLNYSGFWLEDVADTSALSLAANLPASSTATLVGALLALDRPELHSAARQANYTLIGTYHWWTLEELSQS